MTTPPEQPRPTYGLPNMPAGARLPIPGNAEFLLYVVVQLVALIAMGLSNNINPDNWFSFFQLTTVAYILSRGIAKASRVLEQ